MTIPPAERRYRPAAAERRYRQMMRSLPQRLREEAGDELLETFRREHARVADRGLLVRARFWARMTLDLGVTSMAERWGQSRPTVHAALSARPFAFLWHDVRDAVRGLRRAPVFTAVVVLTLALGTGVNAAIFSVLDAVLFKSLPYADADRIVHIAEWPHTGGNFTVAPAAFLNWRARASSLTSLEARLPRPFTWIDAGDPEELRGALVTTGYFDLLGVRAVAGRTFVETDGAAGEPCRVVISHRLWSRRLGGTGGAVGRPLRFSGTTCTLIGVLPPDSVFDRVALDVYQPLVLGAAAAQQQGRMLTVLARLAPGLTIEAARADLVAVAASFNETRGPAGRGWTAAITPLREVVVRPATRQLVWVLFGAVAVVLLVACVNVAALSLSRMIERRRELAVRAALGAGRWRLFRYLLIESLLVACAGSAAGIAVGWWALGVFASMVPAGVLPPEAVATLDLRTLAFTTLLAIATGVVFGTLPAWQGARTGASPVLAASASRTVTASRATARLHAAFLVVEVAMALVLVAGAALLVVSFTRLTRVDPGFDASRILTLRLDAPTARYAAPDAAAALYERTLDAIGRIPAVTRTSAITSLPLGGWRFGTTFVVDGVPSDPARPTSAHIQHVAGAYFETLGIGVAAGRTFTPADDARAPLVAVVNETFVTRFVREGPALGRRLTLGIDGPGGSPGAAWEIVGVIRDVKTGGLGDAALATPEIYVPHRQSPMPTMFVALRTASATAMDLLPSIRAAVRSVDPEVAFGGAMTMDERIGASVQTQRFQTRMISALGMLAVLVAAIGVYAVRSQAVRARTREMGIRLALGATRREVVGLVVVQTCALVAVGLAIGLAGTLWLTRFVESWLFATRATDPVVLGVAMAILAAATVAASLGPARRAAKVDPLTTLRQE
jgi:putative ABC transport system permease protein